jgi:hypothetical protein
VDRIKLCKRHAMYMSKIDQKVNCSLRAGRYIFIHISNSEASACNVFVSVYYEKLQGSSRVLHVQGQKGNFTHGESSS